MNRQMLEQIVFDLWIELAKKKIKGMTTEQLQYVLDNL